MTHEVIAAMETRSWLTNWNTNNQTETIDVREVYNICALTNPKQNDRDIPMSEIKSIKISNLTENDAIKVFWLCLLKDVGREDLQQKVKHLRSQERVVLRALYRNIREEQSIICPIFDLSEDRQVWSEEVVSLQILRNNK